MLLGIPFGAARRGWDSPLRRVLPVLLLLFVAALLPASSAARADDEGSRWQVARLRVTEGSVHILPDGGQEWDEAEGNVSLAEGDRVSVPDDASATLSFRGHDALLHGGTDISVIYLRDEGAAYRLSDGKVRFRLHQEDLAPVRVSLPNGARVRMTAAGTYRFSYGDGDEVLVRVPRGEAVISDPEGGKVRIRSGQQAYVDEYVRVSRYDEPPPPDTPAPVLTTEERQVEAPPDVVYELRDYGDWVWVGDYGYCWRPRVAVGWSPFFYGEWFWSGAIGWSWVSYEPWGWYPYHCGRWYQDPRFGWVWVNRGAFAPVGGPGTRFYRPVTYYPATVRMERDGGQLRWVPLAPRERFVRPVIRQDDAQAYRYSRPLPSGTVFSRDWGRGGGRAPESWRPIEPRRGSSEGRPRDDRPLRRIGDSGRPFPVPQGVEPAGRGFSPPGVQGRPSGRERVAPPGQGGRTPRAVPPPGRRAPEPPGRSRDLENRGGSRTQPQGGGTVAHPQPQGRRIDDGQPVRNLPPGREPREVPPPGRMPSAAPPSREPSSVRPVQPVRPAPAERAAPAAREPAAARPVAPPDRGGAPQERGGWNGRPDDGGGRFSPDDSRGGGGFRGR